MILEELALSLIKRETYEQANYCLDQLESIVDYYKYDGKMRSDAICLSKSHRIEIINGKKCLITSRNF
jgi:hypothetical protein